jgi:hypothetical protein
MLPSKQVRDENKPRVYWQFERAMMAEGVRVKGVLKKVYRNLHDLNTKVLQLKQ